MDGVFDTVHALGIDGQEAGQFVDEGAFDVVVLQQKAEDADGEDDEGEEGEEDVVGDGGRHLRAVVVEEPANRVSRQQPQAPRRQHVAPL